MPPWFNLVNYERAAGLNYVRWSQQLGARLTIASSIQDYLHYGDDRTFARLRIPLKFLELLTTSPLPDDAELEKYLNKRREFALEDPDACLVRGMTHGDLSLLEGTMSLIDRMKLRGYTDRTSPAKVLGAPYKLLEREVKNPAKLRYIPLMIDMEAPHDLLVSEFQRALTAHSAIMRKAKVSALRAQSREHWVSINLLPYIDLELWARWKGQMPTYLAVAKAFYNDRSQDDKVRGEVARLANDLLDGSPRGREFMRTLRQQAAVELNGRKKD